MVANLAYAGLLRIRFRLLFDIDQRNGVRYFLWKVVMPKFVATSNHSYEYVK
jgi:hypothetical protein